MSEFMTNMFIIFFLIRIKQYNRKSGKRRKDRERV